MRESLLEFVKKQSKLVDVFSFQEVFHRGQSRFSFSAGCDMNIYTKIAKNLPDFVGYFTTPQDQEFGLAIFMRKSFPIEKVGETFVFRWKNSLEGSDAKTLGKNIQYLQYRYGKSDYTVINFHGLWTGHSKGDTSDRLRQSRNINKFLKTLKGKILLCGDYNLLPNTLSIKLLEKGLRNLIVEYEIDNTRSPFYLRAEKFADYILISPDVEVKDFKVLPDVVSDHLPLYIEFE